MAGVRTLHFRGLVVAMALASGPRPLPAESPAIAEIPNPWERTIQAFERSDRASPPPPDDIVFLGSSSIVGWNVKEAFPGAPVVNRGFGGSQISDSALFAERILAAHAPRLVVFYAGDNDIAGGKSPERVFRDFQQLVERIHSGHPKAPIAFLSIKPSPSRRKHLDAQQRANALIAEFIAKDPRLTYVDVAAPMLTADGEPRPELFQKDRLHMNAAGYRLWNDRVRPLIEAASTPARN